MRRLAVAVALSSLAGCTFTYNIDTQLLPPPVASALVQQYPIAVGFYISPPVRSFEFSREAARVPAGSTVAATFRWAVAQVFARVVPLEDQPSADSIPEGLAGAIVLSDVALHEGDAPIRYEIHFYTATDGTTEAWSLVGTSALWDAQRSSLSQTLQSVGTALSYGIRNQTAKFLVELPERRAVRNWLDAAGIRRPALPRSGAHPWAGERKADKVMILPDVAGWRYTDNLHAMECIGYRLGTFLPPLQVLAMDNAIRLDFYPWLEPSTGPASFEDLRTLLYEPAIEGKRRGLGIRYLLTFSGGTTTSVPGGGILCGSGGPVGGCFGFAWGTRDSSFSATIIDLDAELDARPVASAQSGGVYVPAFVLPVPFLAATETVACERLAREIHQTITTGQ